MLYIIFYFLALLENPISQVYSQSTEALEDKGEQKPLDLVKGIVTRLKNLEAENYLQEITSIRQDAERFLERQGLFCQGELVLGMAAQGTTHQRVKMSSEDRRKCLEELREFHIDYVKNLFDAHKDYIEFQHEKRLEDLKASRAAMLETIKSTK